VVSVRGGSRPERRGGERRFADALTPVKFLLDNLDKGATADERLEWSPDVEPEKAHARLLA
jgi:uncharacterized protein (DUF433 family)